MNRGCAGVSPAAFGDSPKTFQTTNLSSPQRKGRKEFEPLMNADY